MNTPESGRVVVIDDESQEALPLLKVLARRGVSATYFTGRSTELPRKHLTGVRLVFLDLQLVRQTDAKNVCAAIASVLKRVLAANNGPYLLFIWSKHDVDYLDDVKKLFDNELKAIKPITIVSLEKAEYLRTLPTGKPTFVANALDKIEAALKKALAETGAFHLFILWENIVHNAAGAVVNELAASYPMDAAWESNISAVLLKLAEANAGKQLDKAKPQAVLRCALTAFNNIFSDDLLRGIRSHDFSQVGPIAFKDGVDGGMRARLNRKMLTAEPASDVRPGDVFLLRTREAERFAQSLQDRGLTDPIRAESRFVQLEVSPTCDWAQDKWKTHRLLHGVLWPAANQSAIKRAEYLYISPAVEVDGIAYLMVFDLRHMYAVPVRKLSGKRLCAIRQELLVDVQQKLAYHISRPGIQYL